METKKRVLALPFLVSFFIAVISVTASAMVLRHLGWIVGRAVGGMEGGKYDFALIFEQTKDARLSVHWLLPLAFGVFFFIAERYLSSRIKSRGAFICVTVILSSFTLIVAFMCSLMLTRVNGIRFCDLLEALIPLIDKL